jgi:hypothetical protein
MSRLRNRIARRRAQPGEEPTADASADAAPVPTASDARAPDEPRLHGVSERGRARRRLRYLRRLRELQLRDLGGFVLDLYRFGEQRDRLVRQKLDRVIDTDKETHALEALLGDARPGDARTVEIRVPGVGGTCPSCGDFHASDAHFCARCGINLGAAAAAIRAGQAPPPPPEELAPAAEEAAPPPAQDTAVGAAPEDVPTVAATVEDGPGESAADADSGRDAPVAAPVPKPRDRGGGLVDGDWPEADEERRAGEEGEDAPVQLAAVRERQRRATP